MTDLTGTTIVITGGNSGIGKEAAAELAGRGARVVIAARNAAKAQAAIAEIRGRHPQAALEHVSLDLASYAAVRASAAELLARCERIDVLPLALQVVA